MKQKLRVYLNSLISDSQVQIHLDKFDEIIKEIKQFDKRFTIGREQIETMFQALDNDSKGFLNKSEIECLIGFIEGSLTDKEVQEEDKLQPCTILLEGDNLFYDAQTEQFANKNNNNNNQQIKKLDNVIINQLSLEDVNQLRYVYQMSDENNKGYISLEAIAQMLKLCQTHINISYYDSMKILELIQKNQNIYEQKFNELMILLEENIQQKLKRENQRESRKKQITLKSFLSNESSENEDGSVQSVDLESSVDSRSSGDSGKWKKPELFSIRDGFDKYLVQLKDRVQLASQMKHQPTSYLHKLHNHFHALIKALENKIIKEDQNVKTLQHYYQQKDHQNAQLHHSIHTLTLQAKAKAEEMAKVEAENEKLFNRIHEFDKKIKQYDQFDQTICLKDQMISNLESMVKMIKNENQQFKDKYNSQVESYKTLETQYNKLLKIYNKKENKGILKQLNKKQLDNYTQLTSVQMVEKQEELVKIQNQYEELLEQNEEQQIAIQNCQELIQQQQKQAEKLKEEIEQKNIQNKKLQEDYELIKNMFQQKNNYNDENNLKYLMDYQRQTNDDYQNFIVDESDYQNSQRESMAQLHRYNSINYNNESLEYPQRLSVGDQQRFSIGEQQRISKGHQKNQSIDQQKSHQQQQEEEVKEEELKDQEEFEGELELHKQLSTKSFRQIQFQYNQQEQSDLQTAKEYEQQIQQDSIYDKSNQELRISILSEQDKITKKLSKYKEEIQEEKKIEEENKEEENKEEEKKEEEKKEQEIDEQQEELKYKLQDYKLQYQKNSQHLREQVYASILEAKKQPNQQQQQSESFENCLQSLRQDLDEMLLQNRNSVQRQGSNQKEVVKEEEEGFQTMVENVKGDIQDLVQEVRNMKWQIFHDIGDPLSKADVQQLVMPYRNRINKHTSHNQNNNNNNNTNNQEIKKVQLQKVESGGELARMSFGQEKNKLSFQVNDSPSKDNLQSMFEQEQKQENKKNRRLTFSFKEQNMDMQVITSDTELIQQLEQEHEKQKLQLNQLNIDYIWDQQGAQGQQQQRQGFSFTKEIDNIIKQRGQIDQGEEEEEEEEKVLFKQSIHNQADIHYKNNPIVQELVRNSITVLPKFSSIPAKLNIGAQDFLGLQQNEYAIKELSKQGEYINCIRIFSDYMIRINQRERNEKRILLITGKNLYNLDPKRNFQIIRRIPLVKIVKVQISEQQQNLFALIIKDEYDYLIQNFRRNEILMFLIEMFKKNRYKLFEKEFTCKISIRNRGAKFNQQISISHSVLRLHGDLQEGLINSYKLGYLDLQKQQKSGKEGWWGWLKGEKRVEGLFALTNIGLLGFQKSWDLTPFCLVPVIGCTLVVQVRRQPEETFKLISSFSGQEYMFRARSLVEKQGWLDQILWLQLQAQKHHQQARQQL